MHILARPIIYVSLHTVQKLFPRAMILLISRANRDFVSKIHLMTHPRRCQVHKARSVYRERYFFAAQKLIYFSCSFFFLLFFVNHFSISRLTDPQTRQHPDQKEKADDHFKTALEYLLQYIEKDKHFDALFEQITRRIIKSPDKRNLLELAFCLSQIKSITNKAARNLSKLATENKDEIQKALGVKHGLKK